MGEIADQIIDQLIDYNSFPVRRRRKRNFQSGSGAGMWRTAHGEAIAMSTMSEDHIRNCINICKQHGNSGKLRELEAEMKRRGLQNRGP